jgi:hypothetical protein
MFKITRAANGDVVFAVSGRLDAENLGVGSVVQLRSWRSPHYIGLKKT